MNEPFHKDMLDRSRRDRPLYLQVYEILQTHIRDVRNSGNILPSTRELARMFDVAENTIRQAMTLLTDAGLVCRIRHRGTVLVSEQLPDDPQGNSRSIGIVFPAEGYSFWRDLLQIMHSEAEKNGYSLDIYLYCWDNLADERRALRKAFRSSSGVILYPNSLGNDRQLITEFNRRRIPLVLFLLYYDDLDISIVASGNYQAAYELTESLIRKGAGRIAFIHNFFHLITAETRLAGYRKALEDNNLKFDESMVCPVHAHGEDFRALSELTGKKSPDGIVCGTPRIASQILRRMRNPPECAVFLTQETDFPCPIIGARVQTEELGSAVIGETVRRIRNPNSSCRKLQINLKINVIPPQNAITASTRHK